MLIPSIDAERRHENIEGTGIVSCARYFVFFVDQSELKRLKTEPNGGRNSVIETLCIQLNIAAQDGKKCQRNIYRGLNTLVLHKNYYTYRAIFVEGINNINACELYLMNADSSSAIRNYSMDFTMRGSCPAYYNSFINTNSEKKMENIEWMDMHQMNASYMDLPFPQYYTKEHQIVEEGGYTDLNWDIGVSHRFSGYELVDHYTENIKFVDMQRWDSCYGAIRHNIDDHQLDTEDPIHTPIDVLPNTTNSLLNNIIYIYDTEMGVNFKNAEFFNIFDKATIADVIKELDGVFKKRFKDLESQYGSIRAIFNVNNLGNAMDVRFRDYRPDNQPNLLTTPNKTNNFIKFDRNSIVENKIHYIIDERPVPGLVK